MFRFPTRKLDNLAFSTVINKSSFSQVLINTILVNMSEINQQVKLIAGNMEAYVSLQDLNLYFPECVITIKFQTSFNHNDYTFKITNDDGSIPSEQAFDVLVEYLTTGVVKVGCNDEIPVTPEVTDLFKWLDLDDPNTVLQVEKEDNYGDYAEYEHDEYEEYDEDDEDDRLDYLMSKKDDRRERDCHGQMGEMESFYPCRCDRPVCSC